MIQPLIGIFIILHGLVHLWYVVLSFRLVEFQPEMGWTGTSWLLSGNVQETTLRTLAGILFIASAFAFVISGIAVFANADWLKTFLLASALFSSLIMLVFWDGKLNLLVQKGVIGILINLGIIIMIAFL